MEAMINMSFLDTSFIVSLSSAHCGDASDSLVFFSNCLLTS